MARHTIKEASRLTGKARSTIQTHIKNGKISKGLDEEGNPYIDTAELERVYGALSGSGMSSGQEIGHDKTPSSDTIGTENLRLKTELEAARTMLADIRADRDHWRDQAKQLALAPPASRTPVAAAEKPSERVGTFRRMKEFWFG